MGEYLFVIIDEHSRYPVIEIVKSVSANTVIPILDKVISQFGCPKVIKTDNGAPFNSLAFANYSKHIGFYPLQNNTLMAIEIIDIECVLLSFLSKNFVSTKWRIYKGILASPRLLRKEFRAVARSAIVFLSSKVYRKIKIRDFTWKNGS